jgi:hypothetical protein
LLFILPGVSFLGHTLLSQENPIESHDRATLRSCANLGGEAMTIEHVLAQRIGISLGGSGAHLVGFFGANFVVGTPFSWALGWKLPLPHGIALLTIGLALMILGARSLMRASAKRQQA